MTPTPQVNQELPCWHNYEYEGKWKVGQEEDWGEELFHSGGRRDQWEDQWGKNIRMRKELVGLYCLSHIASVLAISQFWWLVLVFYMIYRWQTTIKVSSETPIQILSILFHLSVSPPSSWRLMMVWKSFSLTFSMVLGSGKVTSLRNKYSTFLP